MSYEVLRTATADEQIRDIAFYIAAESGNPDVALRFVDRLEEAASRLADTPRLAPPARWGTLAKRGYRALVVGEYLVLYQVNDERKQVVVHAVLHGRREYWKLV